MTVFLFKVKATVQSKAQSWFWFDGYFLHSLNVKDLKKSNNWYFLNPRLASKYSHKKWFCRYCVEQLQVLSEIVKGYLFLNFNFKRDWKVWVFVQFFTYWLAKVTRDLPFVCSIFSSYIFYCQGVTVCWNKIFTNRCAAFELFACKSKKNLTSQSVHHYDIQHHKLKCWGRNLFLFLL